MLDTIWPNDGFIFAPQTDINHEEATLTENLLDTWLVSLG